MKEREFDKRSKKFMTYLAQEYGLDKTINYWALQYSNDIGKGRCSYGVNLYYDELSFRPSASYSPFYLHNVQKAFVMITGGFLDENKDLPKISFGDQFDKSTESTMIENDEDFQFFEERMETTVRTFLNLMPAFSTFDSLYNLLQDHPEKCAHGGSRPSDSIMWSHLFDKQESIPKLINLLKSVIYKRQLKEVFPLQFDIIKILEKPEVIEYLRSVARIPNQQLGDPIPPRPWNTTVYREREMHNILAINEKSTKDIDELIESLGMQKVPMDKDIYAGDQYLDPDGWYIGENSKGTIIITPFDIDLFVDYLDLEVLSPLEGRLAQNFPEAEIINMHQFLFKYAGYTFMKNGIKQSISYQSYDNDEFISEDVGEKVRHDDMSGLKELVKDKVDMQITNLFLRLMGVYGPYNDIIAHTKIIKIEPIDDSIIPKSRAGQLSEKLQRYKEVVNSYQDPAKRVLARKEYLTEKYERYLGKQETVKAKVVVEYPVDEMDWMIVINQKYDGGIEALAKELNMSLQTAEDNAYAGEVYKDTDGWYIGETDKGTMIICPYPKDDFAEYLTLRSYSPIENRLKSIFPTADILSFHQYKEYLNAFTLISKGTKVRSSIQAVTGPNEELLDHNGKLSEREKDLKNQSKGNEIVTAKLINHHFLNITGKSTPYCNEVASVKLRKMKE